MVLPEEQHPGKILKYNVGYSTRKELRVSTWHIESMVVFRNYFENKFPSQCLGLFEVSF